jgi:sphinganine-1-phosphate aldolase
LSKGCRKYYTDGGNVSGGVYSVDDEHWSFVAEVMKSTIVTNPLHIDEFIFVTQMEAEIIRWTLNLYHGGPQWKNEACGVITSGGTESILLAMLAYREKAKREKGTSEPNIVCSETAHCAVDKACFYFNIELRKIPVNKDFTADLNGIRKAIDSNTICLFGSAPEYAFGMYDNIQQIAALAMEKGIGCHSDCCLGSYVNPFMEQLGYPITSTPNPLKDSIDKGQTFVDFRVPGVTSISCDPHKYAYGPKGCSIAMFREKSLREYQLFCNTTWQGGLYCTTCIAGSRPGCTIAGTWASMLKHGVNGLEKKAKGILEAQRQIRQAFKDDPDIDVISTESGPIFSITSSTVNCIAMADLLKKRRQWTVACL